MVMTMVKVFQGVSFLLSCCIQFLNAMGRDEDEEEEGRVDLRCAFCFSYSFFKKKGKEKYDDWTGTGPKNEEGASFCVNP